MAFALEDSGRRGWRRPDARLGIGGTTAIFGLFNAVLLRPPPYPDADRLVEISSTVERQTVELRGSSFPDYFDRRDRTRSFEGMAASDSTARIVSGGRETPRSRRNSSMAPTSICWERPVAGRLFAAGDHRLDAAPVAVVNEEFWNVHLGVSARGSRGLVLLARLKPGVTREQAQADIHSVAAQLARDYPATNEGHSAQVRSLDQAVFQRLRPLVSLLFAVTLAVLLIACANVASLLLARGEARRHEMSLRRALGSRVAPRPSAGGRERAAGGGRPRRRIGAGAPALGQPPRFPDSAVRRAGCGVALSLDGQKPIEFTYGR